MDDSSHSEQISYQQVGIYVLVASTLMIATFVCANYDCLRLLFGLPIPAIQANDGVEPLPLPPQISIPILRFDAEQAASNLLECSICLGEFVEGDQIRILPRCAHGFHVACIDIWFRSNRSCPNCRQDVNGEQPAA